MCNKHLILAGAGVGTSEKSHYYPHNDPSQSQLFLRDKWQQRKLPLSAPLKKI